MSWHYVLLILIFGFAQQSLTIKRRLLKPPPPHWGANNIMLRKRNTPAFKFWTPYSSTNLWELSGLFEGDIMLYRQLLRNGLLDEKMTWPGGVVPYYIDANDFNSTQIMVILRAFKDYHDKTCIRFRPYEESDNSWILIKGNFSGCWSSVGRRKGGQILNLSTPQCVRHGVVVHELLHSLGFYHQQSATERDDYVRINYQNVLDGHAHNFNKYSRTYITSFGVEYDYQSVMHYSSRAFSKNGKPTIEPLDPNVSLGQRRGMSSKDVSKLNEMYDAECSLLLTKPFDAFDYYFDTIYEYFRNHL